MNERMNFFPFFFVVAVVPFGSARSGKMFLLSWLLAYYGVPVSDGFFGRCRSVGLRVSTNLLVGA